MDRGHLEPDDRLRPHLTGLWITATPCARRSTGSSSWTSAPRPAGSGLAGILMDGGGIRERAVRIFRSYGVEVAEDEARQLPHERKPGAPR